MTTAEELQQNRHEQETPGLEEGLRNTANRLGILPIMEGGVGANLPDMHNLPSTNPPQPRQPALRPANRRVRQLIKSEFPPAKRRKNKKAKVNNDEIKLEPHERLEIPKSETAGTEFEPSQHLDILRSDIVYSQPEPLKRSELPEPKLANQ
jgi:hypothetical protein